MLLVLVVTVFWLWLCRWRKTTRGLVMMPSQSALGLPGTSWLKIAEAFPGAAGTRGSRGLLVGQVGVIPHWEPCVRPSWQSLRWSCVTRGRSGSLGVTCTLVPDARGPESSFQDVCQVYAAGTFALCVWAAGTVISDEACLLEVSFSLASTAVAWTPSVHCSRVQPWWTQKERFLGSPVPPRPLPRDCLI